jgi:signal recognition particle subunit SRP54
VSGKPIKFVGVGEGMDDLEPFYPERMASRILGMGDIATFLEKAQESIDLDKAAKISKKMQKGDYDFNDFLVQSQSLKKLGGMGGMLKMMPGMAGKITDEQLFEAEKRMKRCETIIAAMTEEERSDPELLVKQGGKKELMQAAVERKRALAQRCGLPNAEVEAFMAEFSSMRRMMIKNLKGMDMDAMERDPQAPLETAQAKAMAAKAQKKIKPTRGGGGGFGAK